MRHPKYNTAEVFRALAAKYPKDGTDDEKESWAGGVLLYLDVWGVSDVIVAAIARFGWEIVDGTRHCRKWPFNAKNKFGMECPYWCDDDSWVTLDTEIWTEEAWQKAHPSEPGPDKPPLQ
jgi:hypothetical protein